MKELKIKLFADGCDFRNIINFNKKKFIKGFTTNPSLMRLSGVKNYEKFAKKILKIIKIKPISFEVFSDELDEMYEQAKIISFWGKNVYVKIPITNTKKISTQRILSRLSNEGIKINITAVFTRKQLIQIYKSINKNTETIISIFAGRIADTGRDPSDTIKYAIKLFKKFKNVKILWASTREIFNIIEAERIGCNIITVTTDILKKINLINYNLEKYSVETIKDFYNDALKSKYKI
jgi:transaldolase